MNKALVIIFGLVLTLIIPSSSFAQVGDPDHDVLFYQNDVMLTAEYPKDWDLVKNTVTSDLWIASLYDDEDEWKIQVDLSVYENDPALEKLLDDKIIEYTFLSYFYACDDMSFDRLPFELLSVRVQQIVFEEFNQVRNGLDSEMSLSEWWLTLRNSQIKKMFEEKGVFEEDYVTGYECDTFTPVDFKIYKINGHKAFQYIYSWHQKLPDGNYFENVTTETDIWVSDVRNYVVNVSSETTLDNRDIYTVQYEDIVESVTLQVLQKKTSLPPWIKTDAGLWAIDTISDKKFKSSIGYIITEKILDRPELFGTEFFKTTEFPSWLKDTARWYSENNITEDEFVNCVKHLVKTNLIKYQVITPR